MCGVCAYAALGLGLILTISHVQAVQPYFGLEGDRLDDLTQAVDLRLLSDAQLDAELAARGVAIPAALNPGETRNFREAALFPLLPAVVLVRQFRHVLGPFLTDSRRHFSLTFNTLAGHPTPRSPCDGALLRARACLVPIGAWA